MRLPTPATVAVIKPCICGSELVSDSGYSHLKVLNLPISRHDCFSAGVLMSIYAEKSSWMHSRVGMLNGLRWWDDEGWKKRKEEKSGSCGNCKIIPQSPVPESSRWSWCRICQEDWKQSIDEQQRRRKKSLSFWHEKSGMISRPWTSLEQSDNAEPSKMRGDCWKCCHRWRWKWQRIQVCQDMMFLRSSGVNEMYNKLSI